MIHKHVVSCPLCGDTDIFSSSEIGELEMWESDHSDWHAYEADKRKQRESDESQ